jgi:YD repeat-containing protein
LVSYDHNGNPVESFTRLDLENRLRRNDASRFEYDAEGNLIERWEQRIVTQTIGEDELGQPQTIQVQEDTGVHWRYEYDFSDKLVEVTKALLGLAALALFGMRYTPW